MALPKFLYPREQLAQYHECRRLGNDPTSSFYGSRAPNVLAGHRSAYFNGRRGHKARYIKSSFAYASWLAGKHDREADLREGTVMPAWSMRQADWLPPARPYVPEVE